MILGDDKSKKASPRDLEDMFTSSASVQEESKTEEPVNTVESKESDNKGDLEEIVEGLEQMANQEA